MLRFLDPLHDPEPLIKRVYAYVAYRIGDGPDAEDVTSATFERAVKYRSSFNPRRGHPVNWLLGIADRVLSDHVAERSSHGVALTEEIPDPRRPDLHAQDRVDLMRALAHLSDRDRELLALRYGADLTAREIAKLVGASTNATEVALHRALRRLREHHDRPDTAPRPRVEVNLREA